MELSITLASVVFVTVVFLVLKRLIARSEAGKKTSANIHDKFQRLNKIASQLKI